MSHTETVLVESFLAKDRHGQLYTILVYQDFIVTRSLDGHSSRLPGLKSLYTSDQDAVNWVDENTFEIVSSGIMLKRANNPT